MNENGAPLGVFSVSALDQFNTRGEILLHSCQQINIEPSL
jgi:hypothetical protein